MSLNYIMKASKILQKLIRKIKKSTYSYKKRVQMTKTQNSKVTRQLCWLPISVSRDTK